MSNFDDLAKELQAAFKIECSELLSSLEGSLIQFEQKKDTNTFNSIQRDLHSIKGGSKAVGFEVLCAFTHKLEDYVAKNKNSININFCLSAKDAMENFIKNHGSTLENSSIQQMQQFKWIN